MRFSRRSAWGWALPLMLLMGGALVLPFVWRTAGLLSDCITQPGGCAFADLTSDGYYLQAAWNTWWLSCTSALVGLLIGLGAAIALQQHPRGERWVSGLASLGANLSGVPLAMALLLLFGSQGAVTLAGQALGLTLGPDLQGLGGLLLAYVCFQAPLAVLLLMAPVRLMEGSLAEAAATLGASPWRFWRQVGLPLLLPSLVETFGLLFANAAAAFATPFALAGTAAHVLAVRIASLVTGDIFAQPELSAVLGLVLFLMMAVMLGASRWVAACLRRTS
ncbi:ABC transporter permease subunit [Roseateles sp. SL47]|uniref:ABC transporter permease n=1 Tax=Roseateles sp. SL47 TaxID=2995138 RepID=UPI002271C40A|nr:ABC transporter permease subunit [Roseateles sp. SL47]WAC73585.1 ABC transporter permease subunit [Roseateles sp. SL47]